MIASITPTTGATDGAPDAHDQRLLVTAKEAGELLGGISVKTISRWVQAGRMPAPVSLPGRRVLFSRKQIENWVENGCAPISKSTENIR